MKKYNIVYLTTYIDKEIEKIVNLPYSAAGLKKKEQIISILEEHTVTIIFTSLFSRIKNPINKSSYKILKKNVILKIPFFVKLPIINYILNPISVFISLVREHKKGQIDYIILYNCVYENVIPTYIFYKIYNVKVICQYEDGWVISKSGFKQYIYKLSHDLAESISSGIITNSSTFLEIFRNKKFFIFRGNIEEVRMNKANIEKKRDRLNILFASSIDNVRGIELLIDLFISMKDKTFLDKFHFTITGKGNKKVENKLISAISKYTIKGGKATYLGYVSLNELKSLYIKSNILLALQKPDGKFSKYCFPSKIFEYYQYNKQIITTNISDLDSGEFFNLKFVNYSVESLVNTLNEVENEYAKYEHRNLFNSCKLQKKYSKKVNQIKMNNFLRSLDD